MVFEKIFDVWITSLNYLKKSEKCSKLLKFQEFFVKKYVCRANKEKRMYGHTCAFILLPYSKTCRLNIFLNLSEQFCHPLPKELDHCAVKPKTKPFQRREPRDRADPKLHCSNFPTHSFHDFFLPFFRFFVCVLIKRVRNIRFWHKGQQIPVKHLGKYEYKFAW